MPQSACKLACVWRSLPYAKKHGWESRADREPWDIRSGSRIPFASPLWFFFRSANWAGFANRFERSTTGELVGTGTRKGGSQPQFALAMRAVSVLPGIWALHPGFDCNPGWLEPGHPIFAPVERPKTTHECTSQIPEKMGLVPARAHRSG